MEKKQETMSNWNCVTELLEGNQRVEFGKYASYLMRRTPRRLLYTLSYFKFAAKMIGKNKRVLDVGCNEGLGTWVLAKECGYCKGMDFDATAIETARHNFSLDFECEDFLQSECGKYDAVVNFDVIEHIYPENASSFIHRIALNLHDGGVALIGTPSLLSQQFASPVTKKGHVNVYTHERLEKELREHFEHVFLFAAHDEVIHTGYLPLAHYYIALACAPK